MRSRPQSSKAFVLLGHFFSIACFWDPVTHRQPFSLGCSWDEAGCSVFKPVLFRTITSTPSLGCISSALLYCLGCPCPLLSFCIALVERLLHLHMDQVSLLREAFEEYDSAIYVYPRVVLVKMEYGGT